MWSSTINYFKGFISSTESSAAGTANDFQVVSDSGPGSDEAAQVANLPIEINLGNKDDNQLRNASACPDEGAYYDDGSLIYFAESDSEISSETITVTEPHNLVTVAAEPIVEGPVVSELQGQTIPVFEIPETNFFSSKEEAIEYVKTFSTSNGFNCSIKNSSSRQIWLQCTCSGLYRPHRHRLPTSETIVSHSPSMIAATSRASSSLKTNCPFLVTINYTFKDCGYHICIKDDSHNHQAIPLDILGRNRIESLKKYHGPMIFSEFENGLSDKDILLRVRKESKATYTY